MAVMAIHYHSFYAFRHTLIRNDPLILLIAGEAAPSGHIDIGNTPQCQKSRIGRVMLVASPVWFGGACAATHDG